MLNVKHTRIAIFAGLLVLLLLCTGLMLYNERQFCMDVAVAPDRFLESRIENPSMDISTLLFNGQKIGEGKELTAIYISQPVAAVGHFSELYGTLTTADSDLSLYFMNTPAINNIDQSIQSSAPLSLVVTNEISYRKIDVYLTTLPVLYIEQLAVPTYTDEQGREVKTGGFTLFGKAVSSSYNYCVDSGITEYHTRGKTSSTLPKKPLKLSLKDNSGNNTDHDLLYLGSDDDWILNPMNLDDTKVREKVAMDFWNQSVSNGKVQYNMSSGEYVEVVIDNEYMGLYLLQRRVDRKYLQLNKNTDILLKGAPTWVADDLDDGYEIEYSPYNQESTYQILSKVLAAQENNKIDLDNYIKSEVFLNYFCALDNSGFKNMFYVLQKQEDGYVLNFVPWDTDMSMGVTWDNAFVYDYSGTLSQHIHRQEYADMESLYPELGEKISSYWTQSREEMYSWPVFQQLLEKQIGVVCNSGAYYRDVQKWGLVYGGKDSHDALYQWCKDRLSVLDMQYAK